jgi:outer membrane autotransporter protein
VSVPALADGGNGGPSNGIPGGVGGTGFNGAPGADATINTAAGAGGGGAGGGNGGNGKWIIGSGGSGGGGGLGGTLESPNGQGAGPGANGGGGGGGGGGYHGNGAGASSIANTATLTGGNGGNAGGGSAGGGGGGAGGYGALVTGAVASSNNGAITAGAGGIGGLASSILDRGGNGGDGGVGVQFTASGSTFTNSGTVSGGNGGASGGGPNRGAEGMGGVGIAGANLTIINSGTISGGLSGDTLTRANAITFTGGVNILELRAGSSFVGKVVAASTADTLRLGGSTSASFDLFTISDIGPNRGFGNFEKTGSSTWTLTGTSTVAGQWTVNGGTLLLANSQLPGNAFTVNSGAMLGGTGRVGTLVVNGGGTLALGNVISTIQVNGNYTQGAGSFYQVAVNAAGENSRLHVSGTATLNGGTVQVVAASGTYAPSTTYPIVNAIGGLSGTFSNVSSNFAFLTPSLSYDANNVFLTLTTNFTNNSPNPTQTTVGTTLNGIGGSATGDMLTVLTALSLLNPTQAEYAIRSISGQNLSGFSTTMVQTAQMFMNNLASQAGSAGGGNRVMMAEACDVTCDATNPAQWGAWGGAVGGLGTIGAGQSVGAVTYNAGGFAAGLDRRFGPSFLAGVTVGFATGTQWVSGFDGKGTSDTLQVGLYGSFTRDRFYLDGLLGYGYAYNQSWRNIVIPGLQPRMAMGQAGANQFFGQLETGYRVDIGGGPTQAYVTPFARLQGYTATQNAYTETGAQSLNLSVAGVTTNSLRSVLGAVVGANMNVGWRSPIAGQLRLGWSHEYGNVDRPVTSSFVGVSSLPFTTFGVSPQRDGVLMGLSLNTDVADATSLYLKYEGTISGQDSAHAMTVGVRVIW